MSKEERRFRLWVQWAGVFLIGYGLFLLWTVIGADGFGGLLLIALGRFMFKAELTVTEGKVKDGDTS